MSDLELFLRWARKRPTQLTVEQDVRLKATRMRIDVRGPYGLVSAEIYTSERNVALAKFGILSMDLGQVQLMIDRKIEQQEVEEVMRKETSGSESQQRGSAETP